MKHPVLITAFVALTLTACATTPPPPEPAPTPVQEQPTPAQIWQQQRTELMQELRANPFLSVTEHGNGDVLIQIRSAGAYRRGKASFSEEQGKVLGEIATAVRSRDALRVKLIGHTDSAGSAEGNLRLSTERAEAVRELFVSAGVDATRIEAVGVGADEPIAPNTSAEGRAVNRRVDVLIVPAL
jgi:outer membrane protein OmpA-like peptidoglycan-associated protein